MKNYTKFFRALAVIALLPLLALGCNRVQAPDPNQAIEQIGEQLSKQAGEMVQQEVKERVDKVIAPNDAISYSGEEGKNALELLKSKYKVETQNYSGMGEFVKSINGITPGQDSFWSFYVNGQISQVGAGAYQTKSADKIEWRIEKVEGYNP